jgi:hypothetical protein
VDLGAVSERVSESTAAISPSANTKPVMVAGIIATHTRSLVYFKNERVTTLNSIAHSKHAAPLEPMENHWQAKRLGLGVSCTLHNANVAVGGALLTAFAPTIR